MRAYTAASEETVRAQSLLEDWTGEGFLSREQYQRLKGQTVPDLRTTNVFLRVVLFLFTVVAVGGAVGLFFTIFPDWASSQATGMLFMVSAAVCYAAAEAAVSKARLYRHGIEEALAVCSVGLVYLGILLFSYHPHSQGEFLAPISGALASLWIWRRFGLWYAFAAAMIFAASAPEHWAHSSAGWHGAVAAIYAIGLAWIIATRPRDSFDCIEEDYSLAEAFLWLGLYLALNLQISWMDLRGHWWGVGTRAAEFAKPFYWTTWVLIWIVPTVTLARGIRQKDRFVIAVGGTAAVLTFVSNKPYLGWARHTWDPMILGALLMGIALWVRRWLTRGGGQVRGGFTAARLSGRDKKWLEATSTVLGLVTPQAITPSAQPTSADFRFGGGASGGGGAGGEF